MNKKSITDLIKKYIVFIIPVAVIALVAVAVVFSLNMRNRHIAKIEEEINQTIEEPIISENVDLTNINVPLAVNTDDKLAELVKDYYAKLSAGDVDGLDDICDAVDLQDKYRYEEQAPYITYEVKEIYVQQGLLAGSYITYVYYTVVFDEYPEQPMPAYNAFYVKSNENDEYYIVKTNVSDEENAYIATVAAQDDVIDLNNRITVEYNDIVVENPEVLTYLSDLDTAVSTKVGERLAALNIAEDVPSGNDIVESDINADNVGEINVEPSVQYATATTTVNVRASDSGNADKLGSLNAGTKVTVKAVQLNGWTKIVYSGKDGYVKSEYLALVEGADSAQTVGSVTATTNVNVRAGAVETADRLGVLRGGESIDLVAIEGDWCKVKYNGQLGYVKSDYVTIKSN